MYERGEDRRAPGLRQLAAPEGARDVRLCHLREQSARVAALAQQLLDRVDRYAHRVVRVNRGGEVDHYADGARHIVHVHHACAEERDQLVLMVLAVVVRVALDEARWRRQH